MKALYKHDCETCAYLGTYNDCDLYYCPVGDLRGPPTVIARASSEPRDYESGIALARFLVCADVGFEAFATDGRLALLSALRVAYLIARDAGLATDPAVTVSVALELRKTSSAAHDNQRETTIKSRKNRKNTVKRG